MTNLVRIKHQRNQALAIIVLLASLAWPALAADPPDGIYPPFARGERVMQTTFCADAEDFMEALAAQAASGSIHSFKESVYEKIMFGQCIIVQPLEVTVAEVRYAGNYDDGHNWIIKVDGGWYTMAVGFETFKKESPPAERNGLVEPCDLPA